MPRVTLELSHNEKLLLSRVIAVGDTLVGGNPECDICLPIDDIAPVQFSIRKEGAVVTLINRSSVGTSVERSNLSEIIEDSKRLAHGDLISIGHLCIEARFDASDNDSRTETLMALPSDSGNSFTLTSPTMRDKSWTIDSAGLRIGSASSCDLVVKDPYLSSQHAELRVENGRCVIRDLGSRNGVFLGKQKVKEGEVQAGTPIRMGQTDFELQADDHSASIPVPATSDGAANSEGDDLIGSSEAMQPIKRVLKRIAPHDAPVLITGETGTGKEVIARLLATHSSRSNQPFIVLNCGGLARNLMESELFGHEKGAFTGATSQKRGAFEAADGGTLFLDEIGELPMDMQPQLLRALENHEIRRVGGVSSFKVNVRIIAATNRTLEKEVREGRFREDLLHRLHVLSVHLPPLRERGGDVKELTAHFMTSLVPQGENVKLSADCIKKLSTYSWPGNIRELRNVLQRAILLREKDDVVSASDIEFMPSTLVTQAESLNAIGGRTLAEIEKEAVIRELRSFEGNRSEASASLGISRSTIHRKIEEYGIDVSEFASK